MKHSGNLSFSKFCVLALMFLSYGDTYVIGAPKGAHVVSGTASFTQDGNLTVITAGNRAVINYGSFNIAGNEIVRFVQPSAHATVLNRVTDANPTHIFGQLQANGIVVIANPYGIFFQNGSVINVGGLYAGTGKISDADFTAGRIHFTDLAGDVRNDGVIAADNRIALMGANVVNTGTVSAARGVAMMVSGPDVYVGEKNGNIFVQANGASLAAGAATGSVNNSGKVMAPRVVMGAGDLYSTAIVNSGLLQGRAVTVNAGPDGTATVGGTIDASSASHRSATGQGGRVQVLGGTVALQGATIDASGANGGGSVRVGGDWHGGSALATSQQTTVDAATTIKADASGPSGNGGSVVVWSDAKTGFAGQISARGGTTGGDGGQVEVSSHDLLSYTGLSDLRASAGRTGSLLLDPHNVTIVDGASAVPSGGTSFDLPLPTTDVTIQSGALQAQLALADTTLQANNDILFTSGTVAPTTGNSALTLQAGRSITFGATAILNLRGGFSATFNDAAASAQYRDQGATATDQMAVFSMATGSSITTLGNVSIKAGTLAQYTGGPAAGTPPVVPAAINTTINANTGDITLTNITTSGATAGNIDIEQFTGTPAGGGNPAVPATTGKNVTVNGALTANSTATGAAGGNVTVISTGTTAVGAISANGTSTGGTVTIQGVTANTLSGAISANGTGTAAVPGPPAVAATVGNGGTVAVTGAGTNTLTGSITANGARPSTATGAAGGGTVNLVATTTNNLTGTITAGDTTTLNTTGGTVTINAPSNTVGAVTAKGTGGGGTVTVTGTTTDALAGLIDTGAFTAAMGSGGFIRFNNGFTATTSGAQNYNGPVLVRESTDNTTLATTLLSAGGNVTFQSTVDGPSAQTAAVNSLNIATAGNVVFQGVVGGGQPLLNLTTGTAGSTGTTLFSMAAPTATTNTNGGVNLAGALTVNDNVNFAVTGIAVPTGAGTPDHASVVTTGAQLYKGNALLAADTYLKGGASVDFAGSVNRDPAAAAGTTTALTVAATGAVTFETAVGTTGTALDSLDVTGSLINLDGSVTTAGEQSYHSPVQLGGNLTLNGKGTTGNAGVAVRFDGAVNSASFGPYSLTIANAAGAAGVSSDTIFGGAVGGTNNGGIALSRLTTSAVGTTQINGGGVTTSDGDIGQLYRGATSIGATTTLSAGSGSISFNSTLGSTTAPQALTVATSGTTTFGAQVGGVPTTTNGATSAVTTVPALASLAVTGGPVSLAGGVTTVTGAGGTQSYTGQVTLTGDTILTGNTVAFTTGFLDGGGHSLTLNLNAAVTVDGNAAITTPATPAGGIFRNLANFTANAVSGGSSKITLDGLFATSGSQTYYPVVNLSANTTLRAGAGGVAFNAALTSTGTPYSLAIGSPSAPVPSVAFNGPVGTTTDPLLSIAVLSTTSGAGTTIGGSLTGSGTVVTKDTQTYGALTLGVNTALTAGNGITVGSLTGQPGTTAFDLTVTAPGTTFGVVNSAGALDFEVSGVANFNGNIGNTASLLLGNAGGTAAFGTSANTVATSGFQTYKGKVTLGAMTTGISSSTTGDITFAKTVDGATALTVNAASGSEIFGGQVGAGTTLTSLTTGATGKAAGSNTQFNMAVTTGVPGVKAGTVTVNDGAIFDVTSTDASVPVAVSTSGAQVYSGASTLSVDTTLASTGASAITFNGTVDGAVSHTGTVAGQSLTVNTAGLTTFGAPVGTVHPLNLLATDKQTGTTDAGTIFKFDLGAFVAAASPALAAGVGGVNAGTVSIADPVTFQISGGTSLNGPNGTANAHPSVAAASQTYGSTITLAADTVLKGTTLSFPGVTGGGFSLTLDFTGTTFTLPGTIAGINNLAIIGAAQINGDITTKGYQYFGGAVTLAAPAAPATTITLTSGSGGSAANNNNITFNSTLTGAQNLVLDPTNGGSAVFGGIVGGTAGANLASLTVNGPTIINSSAISTNGLQTYAGTLALNAATTLTAGGAVTVTGTTSGANGSLTVNAASGAFGTINLGGLLDLTGATTLNGNVTTGSVASGQIYRSAVTLGNTVVLNDTANGPITLKNTVNSDTATSLRGLTINTGGLTTFNGFVGNTNPLGSLTTDKAGAANEATVFDVAGSTVNGTAVVTTKSSATATGAQTYNDAVVVKQLTWLFANRTDAGSKLGDITFGSSVDSFDTTGQTLSVSAYGNEIFGGLVGNGHALGVLGTDQSHPEYGGQTQFNMPLTGQAAGVAGVNVTGDISVNDVAVFKVAGSSTANALTGTGATVGTNNPTIHTGGVQNYNGGTSLLQADTVLQGAKILLVNGVNGSPSTPLPVTAHSLVLDFTGAQSFALGSFTGLKNFALIGGGATQVSGTIQTAGFQYFGNATTLTGATTVNSTGGNIVFDNTLNGTFALNVNTPNDEIFNNVVGGGGSPLASLTTDSDLTLSPTGSGATRFNLTLTATTGAVAVNVAGAVSVNDAAVMNVAGGVFAPASFTSVQTGTSQTYNKTVSLSQDTVLSSTGAAAVGTMLFRGTVDGAANLTVNAKGTKQFNGRIGGTTPLLSLTTDLGAAFAGGTTIFNVDLSPAATNPASVTTVNNGGTGSGAQNYNGAVQLAADTILTSIPGTVNAGGAITFFKTVDSGAAARGLTVVTSGTTTFDGQVGHTAPLGNLTLGVLGGTAGQVVFNVPGALVGDTTTTTVTTVSNGTADGTGLQTYNGPVILEQPVYLFSNATAGNTGGDVTFNGTVNSFAGTNEPLDVTTSGNEIFNQLVGNNDALSLLATDPSLKIGGQTQFNMSLVGLAAGVAGVNVKGDVSINDTAVFNVLGSSTAKISPTYTGAAVGADQPTVRATGTQSYNFYTAILQAPNTVLQGTTVNFGVGVNGTYNGTANNLTLDVSGAETLALGTFAGLNNFALVGGSPTTTTTLNTLSGTLATAGFQYFANALTLGGATALSSSGAATNIVFDARIDGNNSLAVSAKGDEIFNQLVGSKTALASLSTDSDLTVTPTGSGATRFNLNLATLGGTVGVNVAGALTVNDAAVLNVAGGTPAPASFTSVQTGAGQTYVGAVTLAQDTVLTSTGSGTLLFRNTVDGAANLLVNTKGAEQFNARVGGTTPLLSLTTDLGAAFTGGTTIFNVDLSPAATNPASVTTVNNGGTPAGAQSYHGAVQLAADTTLASIPGSVATGGIVHFYQTIGNSTATARALTVLAGPGQTVFSPGIAVAANRLDLGGATVIFDGSVGTNASPLSLLRVGSSGGTGSISPSIDVNNVSMTTSLGQSYNAPVVLSASTLLADTNGGNIVFSGTVDSLDATPQTLTLNTNGTVTFSGLVGSNHPLAQLTSLSTTGTVSFSMNAAGQTAGVSISTGGVNIAGPVVFNIGGVALNDINHVSILTGGAQTYSGKATLQQGASLYSSGGADITFGSTVDSVTGTQQALAINTTGNEVFKGIVGGTDALASLVTDGLIAQGGQTSFQMNLSAPGVAAGTAGVRVGSLTINDKTAFATTGSTLVNPSVRVFNDGTQEYGQQVDVQSATVLVGSTAAAPPASPGAYAGGGLVLFDRGVTSTAGAPPSLSIYTGVGSLVFQKTVSVGLLDATAANVTFTGTVDGLGALLVVPNAGGAGGEIDLNGAGNSVATTAGQVYRSPVFLGTNALLANNGTGDIAFVGTVDADGVAARTLTLTSSGQVIFGGLVGNTHLLDALTSTAAAATRFNMDAGLANVGNGGVNVGGGGVAVSGPTFFNVANATLSSLAHPSVLSVGTQNYNGAVTLTLDTALASSGGADLVFQGTVNGARNLALNTGGNEVFFGRVGNTAALTSLVVDNVGAATGQTQFNMDTTTAAPAGPGVAVGAGGITINDTVRFNVSNSSAALPSVQTLNGGAQDYQLAATLGADTFLTADSGPITLRSTVDGARNLALNTGGTATFGGLVGSGTAPLSLVSTAALTQFNMDVAGSAAGTAGVNVGAGGLTVNGPVNFNVANVSVGDLSHPAVQSVGAQSYNGAAVLLRDTSLSGTAGADITFASTVDGTQNLVVNTAGNEIFNDLVGNSNPLLSLFVDTLIAAKGQTQFNMNTALAGTRRGGVTVGTGGLTINDVTVFNVGGSTATKPSVQTLNGGAQTYNGAARLVADTVLRAGAGAEIVFNATLNGLFNLLTNTDGATRFNAQVGGNNALASLTTNGNGQTVIAGGGITTANNGTAAATGTQTYNEAVVLTNDATLASNGVTASLPGGSITFNQAVSGPFKLAITTSGQTVFNNGVGTGPQGALTSLTTDAAGVTQFNLDLTATPGASAFPAAVVVNGPVALGDAVVFNVNGASLAQPTVLTLGDGTQSYNGLVTLNTNTFLVSATALPAAGGGFAGGGLVAFGANGVTSGGGKNLFVRTGVGTTTFGSTINVGTLDLGGALATFTGPINLPGGLLSAEPNGGGTGGFIQFNGGGLTTEGAQAYNVGVILGANAVFASLNSAGDGGAIVFTSTVDSDGTARSLTLNTSGDEIFNGIVGGRSALASLTTDAPGPVGGTARFNMDVSGAPAGVAGVNVSGDLTINDAARFNVAGSTLDSLLHPSIQTGGRQTYNGLATLAQDTALASSGGGAITFNATVDGAFGLALSTAGTDAFNGIVGGTSALASLTTGVGGGVTAFNMNVANAPAGVAGVNVAGSVTLNNAVFFNVAGTTLSGGPHASVLTGGAQTYASAATLGNDASLVSNGGGTITFGSTVNGAFGLALATGGDLLFNGIVGAAAAPVSLTTNTGTTHFNMSLTDANGAAPGVTVNGPVVINGAVQFNVAGSTAARPTIQTRGGAAQTYNGAALLSQNTVLAGAANGAVTFNKTVDGGLALMVNTGGVTTFADAVGGAAPLLSLTTNAGGTTQINGGSVRTTEFQTYGDTATMASANGTVTLSSANQNNNGAITFGGLLDGAVALAINTGGSTIFNGVVGGAAPLLSLTTDAGGTTQINGGSLSTTGFQTYGDAVSLTSANGATRLFSSNQAGNGSVTFATTLNGAVALTIDTGATIQFGGRVGGDTKLTSLKTTNADATLQFSGGAITTVNDQNYSGHALLNVSTTLTSTSGGSLIFNNKVDGGNALDFRTAGSVILRDVVGGGTQLLSLTTSADSLTIFSNGRVTTTDVQSYGGASELRADTRLTSTSGGGIALNGPVTGAGKALVLDARGDLFLGGTVGGSAGGADALASLTTTGGGRTVFQGGSVNTTGAQSYGELARGRNGASILNSDTLLTSTNRGAITFNGTVDGSKALSINTDDQITFKAEVGGTTHLASLSTNGGDTSVTSFQGGTVTTDGLQNYGNRAELGVDTTLVSTDTGGVVFSRAVDGAQRGSQGLVVDSRAGLAFNGNVGDAMPLRNLFVTGTTSVGGQRVTTTEEMRFKGDVVAPTGALKLQSGRLLVQGNMETLGDLDLETTQDPAANAQPALIYLTGTRYLSDSGSVFFNQSSAAPVVDNVGTIVFNSPNNVTIQGEGFRMGNLQKIYSQGSLTINVGRGTATVGDIAARFNLTINAGTISLLGRTRGTVVGSRPNDGLNFVADQGINFGKARIVFDNSSTDRTASFITTNGNTTIQRVTGVSLFKDQALDTQFRSFVPLDADNFFTLVDNPIQPVGGGSQTLDTAAALSGALPDQKPVDVAADITITASQLEELKKLGIHPRKAQKSERAAIASKRALFAQLVDGQDTANYGRLQPVGSGVSQLVPSDFVVVVDRMGEREVSSILKAFEELYGKNKEKAPQIGDAFQTAFNDYTVEKQTADPAGFSPYLQGSASKYPAVNTAVRNFDSLFGYIEHLGLTDKEVAKSEAHIVSDLGVSGLSAEEMVQVIKDLRKKLPPEQKAPSTKLPPSAPASAPAPGASAPATPPGAPAAPAAPAPAAPAKKADAPPKTASDEREPTAAPKTARQSVRKDVAPRKTARQLKRTQEDHHHEVAGL